MSVAAPTHPPCQRTTILVGIRLDKPHALFLRRLAKRTKLSHKKIIQSLLDTQAKTLLTNPTRRLVGASPVEVALEQNRV